MSTLTSQRSNNLKAEAVKTMRIGDYFKKENSSHDFQD